MPRGIKRLNDTVVSLKPTLTFLTPAQTTCNYVTLWFRNVASLLSEGDSQRHLAALHHHPDAAGPELRERPVERARPTARPTPTTCTPTRTRTARRRARPSECEGGNEPYYVGKTIDRQRARATRAPRRAGRRHEDARKKRRDQRDRISPAVAGAIVIV